MGVPDRPRVYTQRPPHTATPSGLNPEAAARPQPATQQRCCAIFQAGGKWRAGVTPHGGSSVLSARNARTEAATAEEQPA